MQPPVPHDYDQIWRDVYGMQDEGPTHRHLARIAGRELARLEYSSVYEVGCGAGHNFDLLTKRGSVTSFGGMDISEVALERARGRYPSGDFCLGDVEHDTVKGQWDLVYCALVLEHLVRDEDALRNIAPAVGKYLVVSTIGGNYQRYRSYEEQFGHVRNYLPGELDAKLERAGFRVLRSIAWGWPVYSPIGRTLQRTSNAGVGTLSLAERVAAKALYYAYFLNSHRRGDILLAVAEPIR